MSTVDLSGHLLPRDVVESDNPLFYELEQDPVANETAAIPSRDCESFSHHWARMLANEQNGKQMILLGDRVVGNMLSSGDSDGREVGYWIDRAHWGKGVATTALSRFLEIERTRPLHAHVAKHNAGSIRVLQERGFDVIGGEIPHVGIGDDGVEEIALILGFVANTAG